MVVGGALQPAHSTDSHRQTTCRRFGAYICVWLSGLAPIPPQSEVAPIGRSKNRPSLSGLYHIAFGLKISDGV